jgi:hypothetical protein
MSHGPVPISNAHPILLRYNWREEWKVIGFWIQDSLALGVVPGDGTEVWRIYI